jgi:hypothetical protein
MNVKVRFKILVVNNLSLPNTPHDSCFAVTFCEWLTLPSLFPSTPILIHVKVKSIAGAYASHVDVLVIRELGNVVGWITKDVDVFAADIPIGCYVAVLGEFISVPPDIVIAISICNCRSIIY